MKIKELFEVWIVKQMGNHVKPLLNDFHKEDGYTDQTINAMWIGFNAGIVLSPLV
jgi:hypothetical protein